MIKSPVKLNIANIPTPVQEVKFEGIRFLMKRDDFTGSEFSGNKIRKLEYLLQDALKEKAEYIFTCGGEQSNHARATTAACVKYGFKPVLFLWGRKDRNPEGNLFINKFLGARIICLTYREYLHVNNYMQAEKKKYEDKGKKVYVIPEGGSNTLGIWGYINFIKELKEQIDLSAIVNIYTASGSGGTAAGLLTGISESGLNIKVSAVNVLYDDKEIKNRILHLSEGCRMQFKLEKEIRTDLLNVISGYSEEGYKSIEPSKVLIIRNFARETGIILDPVYTGKAFAAFYDFVLKKKKKDCLFLHTGGFTGVFSKKKDYLSL